MSVKFVLATVLAFALPASAGGSELTGLHNADLHPPGDLLQGNASHWSHKRIGTGHSLRFEEVLGVNAARFEIRGGDRRIANGWRAELRDPYVASPHEEVWYRFHTLLAPAVVARDDLSVVLAQWHDRKTGGRPSLRPPLALRLVSGSLRLTLWNDAVFANQGMHGNGRILFSEDQVPAGRWLGFVFRVKWSPDRGGLVRVWRDGRLLVDYRGPVGYRADRHGPYFKLGVYTVHPLRAPTWVHHADYRRAASRAGLWRRAPSRPRWARETIKGTLG